jgi:hypothetical protein
LKYGKTLKKALLIDVIYKLALILKKSGDDEENLFNTSNINPYSLFITNCKNTRSSFGHDKK